MHGATSEPGYARLLSTRAPRPVYGFGQYFCEILSVPSFCGTAIRRSETPSLLNAQISPEGGRWIGLIVALPVAAWAQSSRLICPDFTAVLNGREPCSSCGRPVESCRP
jgi:hypothetical protein